MLRLAIIFLSLLTFASAKADTMLVLDGSNSMWGELRGVEKIEIAQEAVGALLDEWTPSEPLGLVVYGHREARSCTDIEVLAAPGSTFGTIRRAVLDIKPKGKTPLTGALISASRTLIDSDAKDPTVVLLTDGIDTCKQDPCEVARLLKDNRIDFVAHVIGFDLTVPDQNKIACIAEETGGQFVTADDSASLTLALTQIAKTIGSGREPVSDPNAELAGLLTSLGVQTSPELERLLNKSVIETTEGDSQEADRAPRSEIGPDGISRTDPSRVLQEKTREVVAQSLTAEQSVLEPIPGTTVVAYGTAPVTFVTRLAENLPTEVLFKRPTWTVYERNNGLRGDMVGRSTAVFPTFNLAVGDYVAVLEADNVMYNLGFFVSDTLPVQHIITLNLGRLTLSIDNLEMVDVYAFRFERGPDSPSIDMTVRGPWDESFLLPSGTYIVQGRMGDKRQTVGPLTLDAGRTVEAALDIR